MKILPFPNLELNREAESLDNKFKLNDCIEKSNMQSCFITLKNIKLIIMLN